MKGLGGCVRCGQDSRYRGQKLLGDGMICDLYVRVHARFLSHDDRQPCHSAQLFLRYRRRGSSLLNTEANSIADVRVCGRCVVQGLPHTFVG